MRIQFSTTEATSSPQLINGLWFQDPLGGPVDPPVKPIDPPDNTGGGGTGSQPEPEEEEAEAGD